MKDWTKIENGKPKDGQLVWMSQQTKTIDDDDVLRPGFSNPAIKRFYESDNKWGCYRDNLYCPSEQVSKSDSWKPLEIPDPPVEKEIRSLTGPELHLLKKMHNRLGSSVFIPKDCTEQGFALRSLLEDGLAKMDHNSWTLYTHTEYGTRCMQPYMED